MANLEAGNWLNQYVAPQLLAERRNYKADFIGVLGSVPQQALTADGVRYNKLINNVKFLVNNTEELTAEKMTGKKGFVEWEKYDTTPTAVDDKEIRNLAYDKRNQVRVKHNECFQIGIRNHTLHKLAPADAASSDMPVVKTTGKDDGLGRTRLSFEDLATYLEKVKKLNLPISDQLYMVLCPQHVTDLILDQDAAKYFIDRSLYIDPITGKVKSFMGFKFFENNDAVYYNNATLKKVAEGTAPAEGDFQSSQFFYAPNTIYHLDSVKVLYSPETTDTKSADPTSIFRTQTYGIVDRIEEFGIGAIVSGTVKAAEPAQVE